MILIVCQELRIQRMLKKGGVDGVKMAEFDISVLNQKREFDLKWNMIEGTEII